MHLIMVETLTLYEDERVTRHLLRKKEWDCNLDLLRTRGLRILTRDRDLVSRGSSLRTYGWPWTSESHQTTWDRDLVSRGSPYLHFRPCIERVFWTIMWDRDLVSRRSRIFTGDVNLIPRGSSLQT